MEADKVPDYREFGIAELFVEPQLSGIGRGCVHVHRAEVVGFHRMQEEEEREAFHFNCNMGEDCLDMLDVTNMAAIRLQHLGFLVYGTWLGIGGGLVYNA